MKNDAMKSADRHEQQIDAALDQALKDFRTSVRAWSEVAYSRPHLPVRIYRSSWRVALAWTLGCMLVSGTVAGGFWERHQKEEIARIAAAADMARQHKLAEEQRAQSARKENNEDLLAKVDSDVSRSVPSAMEPLAQMMSEDETQ